jgi:hypothetical protein
MRNRNIETAKLACFLNSLRPSFIRVVRRKNIERTKRKIGIAAAMKAMILKIIVTLSAVQLSRVEDRRGGLGHVATLRFLSSLIKPDVPISGIRLSDQLHRKAHGGG